MMYEDEESLYDSYYRYDLGVLSQKREKSTVLHQISKISIRNDSSYTDCTLKSCKSALYSYCCTLVHLSCIVAPPHKPWPVLQYQWGW